MFGKIRNMLCHFAYGFYDEAKLSKMLREYYEA
jgi:hypothetical protein